MTIRDHNPKKKIKNTKSIICFYYKIFIHFNHFMKSKSKKQSSKKTVSSASKSNKKKKHHSNHHHHEKKTKNDETTEMYLRRHLCEIGNEQATIMNKWQSTDDPNTLTVLQTLQDLNRLGFVTVNSQVGLFENPWYQRAYIHAITTPQMARLLEPLLLKESFSLLVYTEKEANRDGSDGRWVDERIPLTFQVREDGDAEIHTRRNGFENITVFHLLQNNIFTFMTNEEMDEYDKRYAKEEPPERKVTSASKWLLKKNVKDKLVMVDMIDMEWGRHRHLFDSIKTALTNGIKNHFYTDTNSSSSSSSSSSVFELSCEMPTL